jgi:hypothetical protein
MTTDPCSYRRAITWKKWLACSRENGKWPSSSMMSNFGAWMPRRIYSLRRPCSSGLQWVEERFAQVTMEPLNFAFCLRSIWRAQLDA